MRIRYDMHIFWSDDDGCFVVEVPDLPGCMADGRSYQEAAANAEEAMHAWLEVAAELGRPIPVRRPPGKLPELRSPFRGT
jgi:predicted RNase H-like HicB family nuclease